MFNWWWSNKIAVFDINIAEIRTILQWTTLKKMTMANVRTILRWRMLEQNWGYLWSYTIAGVDINVLNSNKMSDIQTKWHTFEQNVLHSNKISAIRTKYRTSHSLSFRLHASRNIVIVSRIAISRGGSLGFGD
jgi:hypothetical protein